MYTDALESFKILLSVSIYTVTCIIAATCKLASMSSMGSANQTIVIVLTVE